MRTFKYLLLLIPVLYFVGCTPSLEQQGKQAGTGGLQLNGNLLLLVPWGNGQTTVQCVIEEIDSSGYRIRNIAFYRDSVKSGNLIFSGHNRDYPVAVMPLKDNAGNLLTIWQSGVAYRFIIYSYLDGKVTNVLETGSATYPELFYERNNSENLSILVTNVDLVKNKKTKEKDLMPVSATLYRWRDNKYVSVPNIPYSKRFSPIK